MAGVIATHVERRYDLQIGLCRFRRGAGNHAAQFVEQSQSPFVFQLLLSTLVLKQFWKMRRSKARFANELLDQALAFWGERPSNLNRLMAIAIAFEKL